MKKIIVVGLTAGVTLFLLSFAMLYLTVNLFPSLAEEYYNPVFKSGGTRDILFYLHPFVLSLAISWFWERFKGLFKGNILYRGLEFGAVYAFIAMLPVMWITFSAIDVSFTMVFTWFFYGFVQAFIAGVIFAKMNP